MELLVTDDPGNHEEWSDTISVGIHTNIGCSPPKDLGLVWKDQRKRGPYPEVYVGRLGGPPRHGQSVVEQGTAGSPRTGNVLTSTGCPFTSRPGTLHRLRHYTDGQLPNQTTRPFLSLTIFSFSTILSSPLPPFHDGP